MVKIGFIVLVAAVSYTACEKEGNTPIVPADYPLGSFKNIFTAFWNGMNTRYVFWAYDTTDWDRMYSTYQSMFAALDTAPANINRDSVAYQYLKAMTSSLIDGHYDIEGIPIGSHSYDIRPSLNRKKLDPDFIVNGEFYTPYFRNVLPTQLDPEKAMSNDTLLYDGDTVFAVAGTIRHKILYLYFKSFHLARFYGYDSSLTAALDFFRERLSPDSSQYEGAIIDVRSNYGGEVGDFDFLLGGILDAPLYYGYTTTKSGNGRLDYTPWIPAIINPAPGGMPLSPAQKIVVLADNWSQSAAEQLTMAIKVLPNSTFVGDTTWGANGPFIGSAFYTDFFGGSFNIGITGTSLSTTSTFAFVKTSSSMFKYINDTVYEGKGFPPDILVLRDTTQIKIGIDVQLGKAMSLFN
jgi:carboxyl-terminal processing protease